MKASYEEYLDYLKANVSWLESVGDKLSGADERLDYAVKQLLAIQQILSPELLSRLDDLSRLYNELKEMGFIMPKQTDQIRFQETIPITTQLRLEEDVPLDGEITSVAFHFPACASPLNPTPIELAVGHGGRRFMPYGGFIALDAATPVFPCREKVARNETVWCIMRNTDTVNVHTPSVVITICGD